jgi:competence ComEA-like helix-hairpin-helix protein
MVTWNSGFDKSGRPILTQSDILCSSAVNWTDVAYSPLTKLFYGRVADSCGLAPAGETGLDPLSGSRWFGSRGQRPSPSPEVAKRLAEIRIKYPPAPRVRAIDLATGRKVWDYAMGSGRTTGVLATAGNLLFIGGMGGVIALDSKTGERIWHVDAGQNKCDGVCIEASAMTYMVGGKQYIAMSGYGKVIGYSLGEEGQRVTSARRGQTPSAKLKEGAELPPGAGKDATVRACTGCHSASVWSGARFSRSSWDEAMKRMTIRGMTLADDDYTSVLDYLSHHLSGIDVNVSTAAELVRGLGLTQKEANAIVAYREKNGPFKNIDALKRVEGLDGAAIDVRKDMIIF